MKSNYPIPEKPASEPWCGRPAIGWAIVAFLLVGLALWYYAYWPAWLRERDSVGLTMFLPPLIPALVLQSTMKGFVPKFLTVCLGYIISAAAGYLVIILFFWGFM
ncbi:MAG: hypothetical protein JNK63_01495 [Chthonomonas sp.]|nr:hypothetical protein [Chthonomonas sp.]